jgi:hypothetical protein
MLDSFVRFFDLYSQDKPSGNHAQSASNQQLATWRQVVVYIACVVGIIVGPYAVDAAAGTYVSFIAMFGSGIRLFWAIVFGFVLTAFLFKTVFDANTPIFVQIGGAIVSGFASGKVIPKAIGALTTWVSGAGTT